MRYLLQEYVWGGERFLLDYYNLLFAQLFLVVAGAIGLLWFFLWAVLVSNTPDTHRRISEIEKTYIKASLKKEVMVILFKYFICCSIITHE